MYPSSSASASSPTRALRLRRSRVSAATQRPFTVKVPPTVTLPFVLKLPAAVVVALPPTQRLLDTERLVVEALTKVETPETASVPVAVRFATERLPLTSPLPCTERSVVGEVVPMP